MRKNHVSLIVIIAVTLIIGGKGLSIAFTTINAEPWIKISELVCEPGKIQLLLEGLAFDRDGNLFVSSVYTGEIWKITPDKKVESFFKDERVHAVSSIDIHKDGRLFLTTLHQGTIVAINPDGSGYTEILSSKDVPNGDSILPDDLIFDEKGNFYFTSASGQANNPTGKIYWVSSDFKIVKLVTGNLAWPNGIVLTEGMMGKNTRLIVDEFCGNRLLRIDLLPPELTTPLPSWGVGVIDNLNGGIGGDSISLDAEHNVYVNQIGAGKVIIYSASTVEPVAQIVIPDREKGVGKFNTSVAFMPGTDTGFMTASGSTGAWIYKFKALAPAFTLFSHQ
jgi:lactonase